MFDQVKIFLIEFPPHNQDFPEISETPDPQILHEVLAVPAHQIRKSRGALFTSLVKKKSHLLPQQHTLHYFSGYIRAIPMPSKHAENIVVESVSYKITRIDVRRKNHGQRLTIIMS